MHATRTFSSPEILVHVRQRGQTDQQIGVLNSKNRSIVFEGIRIFLVNKEGRSAGPDDSLGPRLSVRVIGDCQQANKFGSTILLIRL